MRIAEMFLDKDALFCYVTNREADGEAEVTLEDAHAVTSAPLVRAHRSRHGVQMYVVITGGAAVTRGQQVWLAIPGGRHVERTTAEAELAAQLKVPCPMWERAALSALQLETGSARVANMMGAARGALQPPRARLSWLRTRRARAACAGRAGQRRHGEHERDADGRAARGGPRGDRGRAHVRQGAHAARRAHARRQHAAGLRQPPHHARARADRQGARREHSHAQPGAQAVLACCAWRVALQRSLCYPVSLYALILCKVLRLPE